jgi:hypothetical protein
MGWRQENIIKSEIKRCLGCGVDAIGWLPLLLYTYTVCIYSTYRGSLFYCGRFFSCVHCLWNSGCDHAFVAFCKDLFSLGRGLVVLKRKVVS